MNKDDFPVVAEWIRRTKLEIVRSAPEGADPTLKGCILCLRQGQHIYSVNPDLDSEPPETDTGTKISGPASGVGSALIWSIACLPCDEFFLITDDSERVMLMRFAKGESYPAPPPYPTTASYYYEVRGTRVIWGRVSDKDLEGVTPSTWDLWHCAAAGRQMNATVMGDVMNRVKKEFGKNMSLEEQRGREERGFAAFVSDCKGVHAVIYNADPFHGRTHFEKGKAYNV
jgi:hypothetical protein